MGPGPVISLNLGPYLNPDVTLLPDLGKLVFSLTQNNHFYHDQKDPFFSKQHVCALGHGINQVPWSSLPCNDGFYQYVLKVHSIHSSLPDPLTSSTSNIHT